MSRRNRGRKSRRPCLLEILDRRTLLAGDALPSVAFQEVVLANMGPTNDVDLADLDGDGDLDAFFSLDRNTGDRVWFNNGRGEFTDSGQSLGNFSSIYAALGDVDADGDIDAFVATRTTNKVWLNDGLGTFADSGQTLGNRRGIDVALGDLDGDGDLDAFVANNRNQGNSVWFNNGQGQFVDSGQSLGAADSKSVELGDLDGDGDLDAIVGNAGTAGEPNTVWFNNGQGQFRDSGQTLGVSPTQHAALGDLDGDGDLDSFFANSGASPDEVWLNNGSGLFLNSLQSLGSHSGSHAVLADFNDDGTLDAMVANWSDQPHDLWLNDGQGHFEDSGLLFGAFVSSHIGVGDLDADGDLDAMVANFDAPITAYFNEAEPRDIDSAPNRVWEFSQNGLPAGLQANMNTDGGATYALSEDAGGRFQIDANSGVVSVADGSRLDSSVNSSHKVVVRATLPTGAQRSRSFVIEVAPLAIGLVSPVASTTLTDRIRLTWNSVPDAAAYEIWRSNTAGVTSATKIATVNGLTAYDDFDVAPRESTYYWLRPTHGNTLGTFGASANGWRATARPEVGILSPFAMLYDAQTGRLTFESDQPLQHLIVRSRSGSFEGGSPERSEIQDGDGFRYANVGTLPAGLSQDVVSNDLEFAASLVGGTQLTDINLVYLEDVSQEALVVYHEPSGNLAVDGHVSITTLEVKSGVPVFGGERPSVIRPPFDVFNATTIFVLSTGGFDDVDFGRVVQTKLTFAEIKANWRVDGSKLPSGKLSHSVVYVSRLPHLLPNQPPVAHPDRVTHSAGNEILNISSAVLTANDLDADGDALQVITVDAVSLQGAAVHVDGDGTVSYDPTTSEIVRSLPAGLAIRDSFSYQIADGRGGYATSQVTVNVIGANGPPIAADDQITLTENAPKFEITSLLLLNDQDEDFGDQLGISSVISAATVGIVSTEPDGTIWYQPGSAFDPLKVGELGTDQITYQITDRLGATAEAKFMVTIIGESDSRGDLDGDAAINEVDIDLMCAEIQSGTGRERFDLDGNGTIGFGDMDQLITNVLHTTYGDVNLDGLFDTTDLVIVFQAGEYNDLLENNSRWVSGDWNCDREFDTSDLILAFQSGSFESPAPPVRAEFASAIAVQPTFPEDAAPRPSLDVDLLAELSLATARPGKRMINTQSIDHIFEQLAWHDAVLAGEANAPSTNTTLINSHST